MLIIQRYLPSFGIWVPCCTNRCPSAKVCPIGFCSSYQRTATGALVPGSTERETRIDSWSAGKFRYGSRYISRSPRVSGLLVVSTFGTHLPPLSSHATSHFL